MISIQTIARRVRQRLHDMDNITYDDEEILDCINYGLRFIRRIIAKYHPALLMSEVGVALAKGGNRIQLYDSDSPIEDRHLPLKIISVTMGDNEKPLRETDISFAIHKKYSGNEPQEFYFAGDSIYICPAVKEQTTFTIRMVTDIAEVGLNDKSPLLDEFNDFLIDYATIRLSVGNEYDMTQETQLIANIVAQIREIIFAPPTGIDVRGYWS